jgi:hypothetical protein
MRSGETGLVNALELYRTLYVPENVVDWVKAVADFPLLTVRKDEPLSCGHRKICNGSASN